jgi:hypothetical protein
MAETRSLKKKGQKNPQLEKKKLLSCTVHLSNFIPFPQRFFRARARARTQ